ncbi:MAG: bifunctional folylpolyglutamate synthase/dihydrofolate synthase [Myxococcaceae bacterium]|nr:bifunctional folylpolyglutamate synthase/dihydrofolate synthase [Myxococcaceae bacterium]
MREALQLIKNPQTHYPAVHVAGTNGKGSTCAFAAACLRAQGYRVGLYTSPHLHRVNERIQINGEPIRDGALAEGVERLRAAIPPSLDLTYFEFGTVLALQHFAEERVDVAVLETGMGGRLDATTAARAEVTAITPVSFDHQEYLGFTLPAIAFEKAGIIRPNVPVVVGRQEPEAFEVIEKAAQNAGARIFRLGRDFDFEPEAGAKYTYRGMRTRVTGLYPGLRGPHQVQNAAVALACLELLEDRGLEISRENARAGLAGTEWPGRLEEFPGSPRVVLDGAHNPQGADTLVKALDAVYPGRPVHLVFGVLADKDWRPMLKTLLPKCAAVYLTPVRSPRTLEPSAYVDEVRRLLPFAPVQVAASAPEALAAARKGAPDDAVVVGCGSLFLVGQLRASLLPELTRSASPLTCSS